MSLLGTLRSTAAASAASALLRRSSPSTTARTLTGWTVTQVSTHTTKPNRFLSSPFGGFAMRSFCAESSFIDRATVTNRVLEVVRKFEKVQPEKVTNSSNFLEDLGLDSLDTVELVMALEDEFGIEIADADAEKILSCTDAVEFVANSLHAK